ncbi:3-hydroxyacyl-CoA dehydrogenase NAD-binding domain-containing protein [Alkalihalobacillus sp. LMS6]|uniref:3-hydroxyacyl-CoA dehydrogenase family protein n=1 Tax=Alkalihalobacillus sp. LMS6 TaxID=2924034 RepID=UPI0020D0A6C4|nr:3-hydroxyacyl-CoA dehydrogenase NAD-binding domain-containing protein [Alkalihalobacillus sp. LMS6]UTR05819.1 3-hydroxyacyl-CoA dehydrogenase NAD-binding domain-containing protein [Alkalihalobacillus sp. LMS6]
MKQVTIVGAGVMGRSIAYTAVQHGFLVIITDQSEQALTNAEQFIATEAEKALRRGKIVEDDVHRITQRVTYTVSLEEACKNADLVIEAVLEDIALKIKLFQQFDRLCKQDAILATNTSTMSPTEIAAQTERPEKCIAMHFFNPAHKMKLVEIIRGLDTSDETFEQVKQVAETLNKETVEVNEFPGFVTSRMNGLIGNEAMNLVMEGVASVEDVDKAMKFGLNHPMGPLELADLVGLDTRLRNMTYLYETLGETYRPCPLLVKYVKAGRLGRKSGRGFYTYDER